MAHYTLSWFTLIPTSLKGDYTNLQFIIKLEILRRLSWLSNFNSARMLFKKHDSVDKHTYWLETHEFPTWSVPCDVGSEMYICKGI